MKKKLYLASPYGFSKLTSKLLSDFKEIFNELDLDILEPFERTKEMINKKNNWAYEVAKSNYNDINSCDCIFAIVNGNPPDEGVMIELGIAIALRKEIFLFRDDFRTCADSDQYPLNLMLFLGLPPKNWNNSYFESIEDITNYKKNFIKWARR